MTTKSSKGPIRIIRDALDSLVQARVGPTSTLAQAVADLDEELGDTEARAEAALIEREAEKSPEQRAAEEAEEAEVAARAKARAEVEKKTKKPTPAAKAAKAEKAAEAKAEKAEETKAEAARVAANKEKVDKSKSGLFGRDR